MKRKFEGRGYGLEIKRKAEDMYVFSESTVEDVAREMDVCLSTIKRWSSEGRWSSKRREYRKIKDESRIDLVRLYKKKLQLANKSQKNADIHAAIKLREQLQMLGVDV